jgi:hypothetical protein
MHAQAIRNFFHRLGGERFDIAKTGWFSVKHGVATIARSTVIRYTCRAWWRY